MQGLLVFQKKEKKKLQRIEQLALAQGYEGFVSLELFNPDLWARDPLEVAKVGMEKMRAYFVD